MTGIFTCFHPTRNRREFQNRGRRIGLPIPGSRLASLSTHTTPIWYLSKVLACYRSERADRPVCMQRTRSRQEGLRSQLGREEGEQCSTYAQSRTDFISYLII